MREIKLKSGISHNNKQQKASTMTIKLADKSRTSNLVFMAYERRTTFLFGSTNPTGREATGHPPPPQPPQNSTPLPPQTTRNKSHLSRQTRLCSSLHFSQTYLYFLWTPIFLIYLLCQYNQFATRHWGISLSAKTNLSKHKSQIPLTHSLTAPFKIITNHIGSLELWMFKASK